MTAKDYLSRAWGIDTEIKALERARQAAYLRATSITPNLSGATVSGTSDPHKFDSLAEYDDLISRRMSELMQVKTDTLQLINAIPKRSYRVVLTEHYLCGYGWETIADHLHFSPRHVRRLHSASMRAVEDVLVCPQNRDSMIASDNS